MASKRPTGLIVAGVVAGAVLVGLVVALIGTGIDIGARTKTGRDAPLADRADSIFAAEHGRGADIDLGPSLSKAERRRMRILALSGMPFLVPVIGAGRIAANVTGHRDPHASGRIYRWLAMLEIEAGRPGAAARDAALAGYFYEYADLPQDETGARLLRLAYGLHRLTGNDTEAALALEHLAAAATNQMEFDSSDALLYDALALRGRLDEPEAVGRVLINLGCNRQQAGEPGPALGFYIDALDHARQSGTDEALALNYVKSVLDETGDEAFVQLCLPRLDEAAARSLIADVQDRASRAAESPGG